MLGRDVVRVAEQAGHEVVGLPRDELDITDADAVDRVVARRASRTRSSTAPPGPTSTAPRSTSPRRRSVNGAGAGNLAAATAAIGCKVVFPSTDYVFDGAQGRAATSSPTRQPALGLRQVEARGRGRDRGQQPAPLHRALILAVRRQRPQLRRHDAGPRSQPGRGRGGHATRSAARPTPAISPRDWCA